MNLDFNLRYIKRYFILSFVSIFFIFQIHPAMAKAINMENYPNEIVTEELRLKVPADLKEIWLNSEKNIWEPWLSSKDGFLGRQLYWDKEKEEALILVNWKSKKLWKSISMKEVKEVQEKFENSVKTSLNVNENPFQLIYEGELDKQV
tara:strand:- start:1060 stop:1503 length:444 start_codon:yes stop_codon:yes gene_type:complete